MFYFIRTFIIYLILLVGVAIGVQKGFQYYYANEHGIELSDAPTPLTYAMSRSLTHSRETETGLILSGMAAQNRRDWGAAWQSFSTLNNKYDGNPSFALRAFTLALGNGEYSEASSIANQLKTNYLDKQSEDAVGESYDLARLFLILEGIKNGGGNAVDYGDFTNGALAKFALPILDAWTKPEILSVDFTASDNIQIYYAALAADYYKKPDIAEALFKRMQPDIISDEQIVIIADFYVRNDKVAEAIDFLKKYSLVLNRSVELTERLNDLMTSPESYQPSPWSSFYLNGPNAGIAMALHDFARAMIVERAVDSSLLFARMAAFMDAKTPSVYVTIGGVLKFQTQDNEAIKAYNLVQTSDPQYETSLTNQIDILTVQERNDQTTNILKNVLEANPENAYYHYLLGNVQRANKDYKDAIESYDTAEALSLQNGEMEPRLWPLYYSRAIAFDLVDRWDDAERDLQMALEKFPDSPIILNYMGYAYADRDIELEKAKDMIMRAVMAAPNDAYIIDSMGWILYRTGDYAQAVTYLERAARMRPYHMVINDHLGDAYWKVGRKLEAHYMWQRAADYYDDIEEEQQRMIEETRRKVKEGM